MTSEVVLMNLEAVVMGADSAVTMNGFSNTRLFQAGVDKIHIVNEAGPVAAMVYGGAAFSGLPWKAVLGQFRLHCGTETLSLASYVSRLLAFLSNVSQDGAFTTPDPEFEARLFGIYIQTFLLDFKLWLLRLNWEEKQPVSKELAEQALGYFQNEILFEDPDGEERPPEPRPRGELSPALSQFLQTRLAATFEHELGVVFRGVSFPISAVRPLMKLAVESLLTEWLPLHSGFYTTGLVLSGFGAGRATPGMAHLQIFGAFGGLLKYKMAGMTSPNVRDEPVVFQTFAQDALIRGFVFGALPEFEDTVAEETENVLNRVLVEVLESIGGISQAIVNQVAADLAVHRRFAPRYVLHRARKQRQSLVMAKLAPLLDSANAGLLAGYAGKLMELPILEHELLQDGSVSRPILLLAMERGQYHFTRDGDGVI